MTTPTATPTIELDPVRMRDLGAIVALERVSFGAEAWGWADFLLCLPAGHIFLKATQAEQLVGFVLAQPQRRRGVTWIANIAVHPAVRNQGIGRRLMEAVEAEAGTRRFKLTVRVDNEAARHLYRSLGYHDFALRRGYYGGRIDGMEMEKVVERPGPNTP